MAPGMTGVGLRALLQRLEWAGDPVTHLCPRCGLTLQSGHRADCELHAWLTAIGVGQAHLRMYVVYQAPADYPGAIVVRGQLVWPGQRGVEFDAEPLYVGPNSADGIHGARAAIAAAAPGAVRLPRDLEDDPVIREVWL